MISKRTLLPLTAAALVLPIVTLLIVATARLLGALGDEAGALVLDRIALAGGMLWIFSLVVLLVALAIGVLTDSETPSDQS